jgi:transcription antitermination factor NusG
VEDFSEGQKITAIAEHRWFPAYCHPNKERMFYDFAKRYDISCYVPEIPKYRVTRNRKITTFVPMFTGYVFCCTTRQQNWQLKQSKYLIRMLNVSEEDEVRLVNELNTVRIYERLALTQDVEVRPEMTPGKRVTITHGSLQGLEGIIKRRKNACEVIVELQFIGCSLATVEVDELELT